MLSFIKYTTQYIHFNQPQEFNVLSQKILSRSFNRILDIGCGGGTLLSLIAQRCSKYQSELLLGIDLSFQRLKQVKFFVPNSQVVCGNVIELPFKDSAIDLIVCSNLLEHIKEDYKMLLEVHRILTKNSQFYLETILSSGCGVYIYRNNGHFVLDPTHFREYSSAEEVYKLIGQAGFKVIESDIAPVAYSICDIILRLLSRIKVLSPAKLNNIYQHHKVLKWLRHILKIRIPGWYFIRIWAIPKG